MQPAGALAAYVSVLLWAGAVHADVWDIASPGGDDTGFNIRNELTHGAVQVHDLGARPGPVADEDWIRLALGRASSYEVVLDSFSGELSLATTVDLYGFDTTVLASAVAIGGPAKILTYESTSPTTTTGGRLRVHGAECGTTCDENDQYTLRFRETTYSVSRFNNSGSQRTLLILQAPHAFDNLQLSGHIYFWTTAGAIAAPLAVTTFTLDSHSSLVLNTSTVPGLAGQSGSITISHTGPYGILDGKAVSIEPATGFSFDTPLRARPF
jgi:hypothetical protein